MGLIALVPSGRQRRNKNAPNSTLQFPLMTDNFARAWGGPNASNTNHEHACPHVSHCPHLGGAALGMLVLAASDQDEYLQMLHGQLDQGQRDSR